MKHPYEGVRDVCRWSRAVAGRGQSDIDPAVDVVARIRPGDEFVTAGSCFAQHVARFLASSGRGCLMTERPHPLLGEELAREFGYGVYPARYGNIYTTRQLLQLWQRATGAFVPSEDCWEQDGAFYDPFRPIIQPGGFETQQELEQDRARHFEAIVEAFTRMDVFIFTMGLTECWTSAADGAVYPLCPGVAVGRFDPERHVLVNLTADEVASDMEAFIELLREVNPDVRIIMTVSPQPQTATAEERHVLVEAGYSKAKLRVAAERVCRMRDVDYFPSYEVVSVPGSAYFEDDRRSVREEGIERVMELFFEHVVEEGVGASEAPPEPEDDRFLEHAELYARVICDEDLIDPDQDSPTPPGEEPSVDAPVEEAISQYDADKMLARALALAGRTHEAIELAERLYRLEPRPGIARLLASWREPSS